MSPTIALDAMLIEREALIASAAITADRVFASAVQTHPWKFDALVDVLSLGEAISPWTKFRVGRCT